VVSVDGIGSLYQEKRLLQKAFETSRFELLPCEGTYFQVAPTPLFTENDVAFVNG
jgi:methionine aminotransferase